jgi:hypothetical protein
MRCQFVAGQRVVCVYDRWRGYYVLFGRRFPANREIASPRKNQIVRIKNITVCSDESGDEIMLELHEFASVWNAEGFRPLQERPEKTDIGVFHEILRRQSTTVKEKA